MSERLYGFSFRTDDPYLKGDQDNLTVARYISASICALELRERGRWDVIYRRRAKQVVQAIGDFQNENVPPYARGGELDGKRTLSVMIVA
jgi:hypothetical protein